MSRREHPFWEDELMPYVDGQLDAAQADGIAEHLEKCEDCAASVADSKRLSQQMSEWKIEDPSEHLMTRVLAELRPQKLDKQHRERSSSWTKRRFWVFGLSGAFAGVVLIAVVSTSLWNGRFLPEVAETQPYLRPATALPPEPLARGQQGQQGTIGMLKKEPAPAGDPTLSPMIIRSARLTLVAKDFEGSRSKLETIVRQSQGYLDQMTVKGEVGSGRVLSATLRLPSDRLDTGLSELRKLGKVLEESQNSSDVTSQYVDLGARLANARNTESRLQTILKERTGKLSEVVDVEREISRTREEIERMEAQQKGMNNQVQYASVQIEMSEEYHAQLLPSVPSPAISLWNASVDGYHTAAESLLDMALLILRYGPALIIWLALLLPIALVLRRIRRVGIF